MSKPNIIPPPWWWPPLRTFAFVSLGVIVGQQSLNGLLLWEGFLPIWLGPELRRWSQSEWIDEAKEFLAQHEQLNSPYIKCIPPNHTDVEPDSERRIRKIVFFNRSLQKCVGIVRFGPDCEGPPRHVHGGCSAAFADMVCVILAHEMGWNPCKVAQMVVNYKEVTPLGSQLGFDVSVEQGRHVAGVKFKMFSLINPNRVYVSATCVFERPDGKQIVLGTSL